MCHQPKDVGIALAVVIDIIAVGLTVCVQCVCIVCSFYFVLQCEQTRSLFLIQKHICLFWDLCKHSCLIGRACYEQISVRITTCA